MIMSYARANWNGSYIFELDANAVRRCMIYTASHEQDDCALFHQMMCVLFGDDFSLPDDSRVVDSLSDAICWVNFSEIFDRDSSVKVYADRQAKAEAMFRPAGIALDLGSGKNRYYAFERSASMSRSAKLSFIREDLYGPVRQRIMLGMEVGVCQLSKLYAYNGLMLSGGTRIDGIDIDREHRVIVVANNRIQCSSRVITVEDAGGTESVRRYRRVERGMGFDVMEFDGEGVVSKEYAAVIDKAYCGEHIHTSFQIRMPYVKGMIHQVDFKDLLINSGVKEIIDIWGEGHAVQDVDIILSESMFKGYGWLKENGMDWHDYLAAFRRYSHALYITNVSKEQPETVTELNYQFLNTLSVTAEEFRPTDLPDGWTESPDNDPRIWLTKQTETEYYGLCADEEYRRGYFLKALSRRSAGRKSRAYRLGSILKKNPLFINEPVYVKELADRAESICKSYALGNLLVAGDNRFLSGDLLRFLAILKTKNTERLSRSQSRFFSSKILLSLPDNSFYSPGVAYTAEEECTLLRNPHIARNEEQQMTPYVKPHNMHKYYLGHLTDVVMVDAVSLAAERLGGADFDGDMIKTIADPIVNRCVRRNYITPDGEYKNHPLLKIPAAEPVLRDANKWHDRFVTVRDTFSSRVGQISNAALDRSIIAYDENSDAAERERCREETETLAILTGLEIDSAKTGVKPDLSEYLGRQHRERSLFLKYKYLVEKGDGRTEWYEPTVREKVERFMHSTDWNSVSSNVERLPYLAYMLRKNTPRIRPKHIPDEQLFSFAVNPEWKDELDPSLLALMERIISEYENCLARIRAGKAPVKNRKRKNDIERILYCRGQEEKYSADELYAALSAIEPEHISSLRTAIREQAWHMMDRGEREAFISENIPENIVEVYGDLLCDFRFGGYRVFGDLIGDIDDENSGDGSRRLDREGDSELMGMMLEAYRTKSSRESYRDAAGWSCRKYLSQFLHPSLAVQYAVALGKRNFMWDVLLDYVEESVLVQSDTGRRKK